MSSQSPIAESERGGEGDTIDENLPRGADGGTPAGDNQERNSRAARLESLIAEQTATISVLVEGIQDTNRLLKMLVSQKAPEALIVPEALVGAAPENEPGPQIPTQDNDRTTNDSNSEEYDRRRRGHPLNGKFEDLGKEYLNSPPSPEVLEIYHKFFLRGIGRSVNLGFDRAGDAVILSELREHGADGASSGRMEVPWAVSTRSVFDGEELWNDNKNHVALQHYISRFWVSVPVKDEDFELSDLYLLWYIKPSMEELVFRHFIPLLAFLVCYVPGTDEIQAPQSLARRWNGVGDLTSPGAFWSFMTGMNDIDITAISRLGPCLLAGLRWPEGDQTMATRHILHGLQRFSVSWELLGALDEQKLFGYGYSFIYHDIRLFSPRKLPLKDRAQSRPYLKFCREGGELPNLQDGHSLPCAETRLSVAFMSGPEIGGQGQLTFRVLLMNNLGQSETKMEKLMNNFMNWEERGFTASGPNAGYMLFQSVLHGMLVIWESEWSSCLDAVDKCVSVKLEDILAIKTSENLMFDDSFQRSRVYFRLLQILRIFFDSVRETGVRLHNMRPENTLKSGYDDKAIQKNWDTVVTSHFEMEKRLLQRIMDKTEEIKSLRDGLFNATSLLEASKSTTMNRYVIVFTIVTVLYLPPSFVATVFGTDLFNSNDTSGTLKTFNITTVVVSLSTYVIALLLVLFVDRKRMLPRMYNYIEKLSTALSRYWNGQKVDMRASDSERERKRARTRRGVPDNAPSRFHNFNAKLPGFIRTRRRKENETTEPDIELSLSSSTYSVRVPGDRASRSTSTQPRRQSSASSDSPEAT